MGIDPARVRLPWDEDWPDARSYLVHRLRGAGERAVDALLAAGGVVTADGSPLTAAAPYVPGQYLWFHREFAPEPVVPFALPVLYRDEHLVVADKPHFLAMTPRGSHITQTALARLRHELDLPRLSPAHRLDRLTAGVALFVVRPEERAAYQGLFQEHRVRKEYRAVAASDPGLAFPLTVRNRITKEPGRMDAYEIPGPPNAESRIELLRGPDAPGGPALYRLLPRTGRTHQLRLHMSGLGLPILNDPLYPEVLDPDPADFSRPLQLLAYSLEFTDPVTGAERRFSTARELAHAPA